eukprot:CAMPEP_0201591170 /NCGR_PEP_ID=MMETSP0190_2-20130828/186274_1 /ASSEMBLY_ACC=CAM_ASM_000263 /TAXON_ID=37353 /ORGANISM="Rosalina sp." /LENGTH=157 /DNA_ID=CAMNT_0048048889 /DNA_START=125 /DNA_END=598 /DNA_ORIENTATION=-
MEQNESFVTDDGLLRSKSFSKLRKLSMQKFKNVLKRRKKFKCPYYITYEDSNKWISAHPEYLLKKLMKKKRRSRVPLLSSIICPSKKKDCDGYHQDDTKCGDNDLMESDLEELSEIETEETEKISPFRFSISIAGNGQHIDIISEEQEEEEGPIPMA